MRGARDLGGLPRGAALGQDQRVGAGAVRVVVGVVHRPLLHRGGGIEPGAIHPAPERVHPAEPRRQGLGRHVDVRQPEVPGHRGPDPVRQGTAAPVPERVGDAYLGSRDPGDRVRRRRGVHEGLVLDDQGDLVRRDHPARHQVLLPLVGDQVPRRLAGVDVQPGNAEGVVVVEHEPGALLVGVVIGGRAVAGIGHVRDVLQAHPLGERCHLQGRGDPLVRGAVADPRGAPAVQVDGGPVLGVARAAVGLHRVVAGGARAAGGAGVGRAGAGPHHRAVHRDEQVARGPNRELVGELDAHRAVPFRDDGRSQVMRRGQSAGGHVGLRAGMLVQAALVLAREGAGRQVAPQVDLTVAAQQRAQRRQVRMHALPVLHQFDLVIVRAGIAGHVRLGDAQVLPQVVGLGAPQPGQGVDEFGQRRAVGPVGGGVVIRGGRVPLGVQGPGRYGRDRARVGRKRGPQEAEQDQQRPAPQKRQYIRRFHDRSPCHFWPGAPGCSCSAAFLAL